jgi:glucose-6-phosphate dehydrogenase assembly protein OpcA
VQFRLGIAQFFDHPTSHHWFDEIETVQIDFAPGYRSTALLLAGWLAAQLRWTLRENSSADKIQFRTRSNRTILVSVREKIGEPISACILKCSSREFHVGHSTRSDLLDVTVKAQTAERSCRIPGGGNDPVKLMREELIRGGPHRVYLRAMNSVRTLL